jgi:hypothetical protein
MPELLALAGWAWLVEHTELLGGIMLFAAGGTLYLVFQDSAPQARMRRHWAPPRCAPWPALRWAWRWRVEPPSAVSVSHVFRA